MDREGQRIEEDLRGQIAGEVRCDRYFRRLYSSDASLFSIEPLGVVRPKSTSDVVAVLEYASQNHIPIHARGAGSGLVGGALGRGLVIDFTTYMRRIIDFQDDLVRVQPGVVLGELNRYLAKHGRRFGPDPTKAEVTTLGGVISSNSSGSHWKSYGAAQQSIRTLQMVLSSGEKLDLGTHALESRTRRKTDSQNSSGSLQAIVRKVSSLLLQYQEEIRESWPRSLVNSSGYCLEHCLNDHSINLASLIAGSEGTLGLITELELKTEPISPNRQCALLIFDRMEKALAAVDEILPLKPSACDLMDRRHLIMAREGDIRFELMIPSGAEAVLLLEFSGDDQAELISRTEKLITLLEKEKGLAAASYVAFDKNDEALCWSLAKSFAPTLSRIKGSTRPVPFIEDIAVHPRDLGQFLASAQNTLQEFETTAAIFAHAGHGQVHIRPLIEPSSVEDRSRLLLLADKLYEKVWQLKGTVSGEHGDGLSRTPYLKHQFGSLCVLFRELKETFDPNYILNPGKIVPLSSIPPKKLFLDSAAKTQPSTNSEKPTLNSAANESETKEAKSAIGGQPQLGWNLDELLLAASACNECGVCRTQQPEERMCPVFRITNVEEASPRAKANMLLGAFDQGTSGGSNLLDMTSDDFKQVVDLCTHCHMCRLECPATVDIPRLSVETKAAYVRANGLPPGKRFMANIDRLCGLASRFRWLTNWFLRSPMARWFLEKTMGISRRRKLPQFAKQPFSQMAKRRTTPQLNKQTEERVAIFVDTYANYFDIELMECLVQILEHNGVSVIVPEGQLGAAMPLIAQGAIEEAKKIASNNVAVFTEAVRDGYTIVTTEPSAALAISREYRFLFPNDEDAEFVANATQDASQYLWQLHQRGILDLNFQQMDQVIGYHVPCHVKALEYGTPSEHLLRLVPGVEVIRLEKGCSGMAGMHGLLAENYRSSLREGRGLINAMRQPSITIGTTECSTCKMQMEYGSPVQTLHPIKILAAAYGLKPLPLQASVSKKKIKGDREVVKGNKRKKVIQ